MIRPGTVAALLAVAASLAFALTGGVRAGGGKPDEDLALARHAERGILDTIAAVRDAVVTISAEQKEVVTEGSTTSKTVTSGGSGVIFSRDGFILTNDHVTIGEKHVSVGLRDGRTLNGEVTGRDRVGDIAVIKVKAKDLPWVALGESAKLVEGQLVLALGNPFGLAKEDHEPAATLGIVSGLHRFQGGEKVYGDAIQIDAAVNPGNSGGPLFSLDGKLIGITGRISIRASEKKNVGVGFAVPIDQVKLVLEDLKTGADVTHGYLGVRFRGEADGDGKAGVEIVAVLPGAAADRVGLKKGDRILSVNGRDVDQPVRLENILSVLPAGSDVALVLDRDGKRLEVTANLGRRPGS
jgi:S1-C subfamily serine protease